MAKFANSSNTQIYNYFNGASAFVYSTCLYKCTNVPKKHLKWINTYILSKNANETHIRAEKYKQVILFYLEIRIAFWQLMGGGGRDGEMSSLSWYI